MHLLYSTNLFKGVIHKYVLHVPYNNQEPCPKNSHWPVTQPAFWSSLDTLNTYNLYFYLWYWNKNFHRTRDSFGPAGGNIGAAVSPMYGTWPNLPHTHRVNKLYWAGSQGQYCLIITINNDYWQYYSKSLQRVRGDTCS